MEPIDYSEIIKLSHLEIKEALHVFLGAKAFSLHKAILFEHERKYLGRDQIGCLYEHEFPCQDYKRKFKKYYDKLLDYINNLLDSGFEVSCWDIRALRKVTECLGFSPLNEQILYLWKTEHLINWALTEGIIFPPGLQMVLGIKQVEGASTMKKANVLHLCLQALAQVIWYECPPFAASHSQVIEDMRNMIENSIFQGKKMKKYCLSSPLDYIISNGRGKYFREEKQNILRSLLKKVDPRPPELKRRGTNPGTSSQPFPPRLISGVFSSEDTPSSALDFRNLEVVLQTIGYYLFGLRKVSDAQSALEHPLVLSYIVNRGSLVNNFAYHCLMTVCPERAYLEYIKDLPKDPLGLKNKLMPKFLS